jgi:hypothetical protein
LAPYALFLLATFAASLVAGLSASGRSCWRYAGASPDRRGRFEELGAVIPSKDAAGPQALRACVAAAEVRKWVPVIRSAGISVE